MDAGSVITRSQVALERIAGAIPAAKMSALTKTLSIVGKAAGIVDAYQHLTSSIDQFQSGDNLGGWISLGKTALDVGFILYKGSNPFVLGASVEYGIYNTAEDLNSLYEPQ